MTILSNDIKVFQAQDNTDNDSGGGSRTAVEVVDGNVNNLFPDISRVDTVSGDVALRKIFPTVYTTNRDVYYGAHAMLRKTPSDPKVSALLFYGNDPHERRIGVQDKIESYVVASYLEQFYLFGNHIAGARTVTFLMTKSSLPPNVGEVYLLKETTKEQYIRIVSVDARDITLTYTGGSQPVDYVRTRVICEIDQGLEFVFTGSAFHPSGQQANTAYTYATQVADAAKFYSTKTLAVNALENDTDIVVDSIFEQLVPASIRQTPLVNKTALTNGQVMIPTGYIRSSIAMPVDSWAGNSGSFNYPVVAGSVSKFFNSSYKDDGKGNIIRVSDNLIHGTIDYATGNYKLTLNIGSGGSYTFEVGMFIDSDIQYTTGIKITKENQGLVFVRNLSPKPSKMNLYVDYRSGGKWYRFQSNIDDTLGFDPQIGAGLISDNGDETSTVSVTLGALPDIDSTLIIGWGSKERFTRHSGIITETWSGATNEATSKPPSTTTRMEIDLGYPNVDPSTFSMTAYDTAYATYYAVTCDETGKLIDAAPAGQKVEGKLNVSTGIVDITTCGDSRRFDTFGSTRNVTINFNTVDPTGVPAQEFATKIISKAPQAGELLMTESNGVVSFSLGQAINDPYSLSISLLVKLYPEATTGHEIKLVCINESGTPIIRMQGQSYRTAPLRLSGTINLTTGDISITMVRRSHKELNPSYAGVHGGIPRYIEFVDAFYELDSFNGSIKYRIDAPVAPVLTARSIVDKIENIAKYKIQTVPNIVGEVAFVFPTNSESNSFNYYSLEGNVFNRNNIQVGTVNKNTGEIELAYTTQPYTLRLHFNMLLSNEIKSESYSSEYISSNYSEPVNNFVFRTSASKLTTSSFQLRYETVSGTKSALVDQNGVFTSGTDINLATSYVDTKTGMVSVNFNSPVIPASIKYDAVAESSLPLDPELLGLNPVRLPSDGRVPVFAAGRMIVIFNEVTTPVVNGTPVADQVETLARNEQSYIEVIDANGKRLNPTQYVADRINGTVTFANPLTLEDKYNVALTAPYYIVDRTEDMLLATDVQINGSISLSGALSRNYNSGVTKVASALVWGDTGARVHNLFTQEIWNSGNPVWSDSRIGDNTTAQYDEINYPLTIDNKSSTHGRWAIIFKSSTTVDVVEEKLGIVDAGVSISINDVAPINPATGAPYFIMPKEGFGAGWVTNNVVRLNTDSGDRNLWLIRTVQSGALSEITDNIEIEIRGDAN